jgi:hypothetical protein
MKTIKINRDGVSVWEISQMLEGVPNGEKFILKVKRGTRWKIRKARATMRNGVCECCGGYTELKISMGERTAYFDNHLGKFIVTPESILNPD